VEFLKVGGRKSEDNGVRDRVTKCPKRKRARPKLKDPEAASMGYTRNFPVEEAQETGA